jgi:hypothetical protein
METLTSATPATPSTVLSQESLSPTASDATSARSPPADGQGYPPRAAVPTRRRDVPPGAGRDRRGPGLGVPPTPPAAVSEEGESEQGGMRSSVNRWSVNSDGPSRAEVASATQAAGVWRGTTATKVRGNGHKGGVIISVG